MIRSRFLDGHQPLAFAHRGGAEEAPENSLAAFEAAVALGFRHLETDAHVTADGVVLAFHDHVLERVTDGTGQVADLSWATVSRARIGGTEPILRLDELLEAFDDVCVNIDAKHDAAVEPVAEVIRRAGAEDRVCLASFDDRRVARLRALVPGATCSLGARAVARLRTGLLRRAPAECAQVPPRARGVSLITASLVERAHRLGLQVHAWTIDDPAEMIRLLDLGVDGIMTDRPSVLRDVLLARGQWSDP